MKDKMRKQKWAGKAFILWGRSDTHEGKWQGRGWSRPGPESLSVWCRSEAGPLHQGSSEQTDSVIPQGQKWLATDALPCSVIGCRWPRQREAPVFRWDPQSAAEGPRGLMAFLVSGQLVLPWHHGTLISFHSQNWHGFGKLHSYLDQNHHIPASSFLYTTTVLSGWGRWRLMP